MKPTAELADAVDARLRAHGVRDCTVQVGLSGGIDSVVLLDVLARLAPALRLRLGAIHVNHGISRDAGQWVAFCEGLCRARGIPLIVEQVHVVLAGRGLEAAARDARHAAFARLRCDYLALAHHLDDQAETLLLQLLRGAGARGLGGMPEVRPFGQGKLLRPLLGVSRRELETYARGRSLAWIEDDSNLDVSLDRNFVRRDVLPLLSQRFVSANRTLARAARNLADISALADALAEIDWREAAEADGLRTEVLRELGEARALNLLRRLFIVRGLPLPHRAALTESLRQCLHARDDAQVRVMFGEVSLRRFRGRALLVPEREPPAGWERDWRGESELALPEGLGSLRFRFGAEVGVSRARLARGRVQVRGRRGGERMAQEDGRPRRLLKHLLQEAGMPPWQRRRIPLLFCDDALVWVPGIGVAAEFRATAGEPAVEVSWQPENIPETGGGTQKTLC